MSTREADRNIATQRMKWFRSHMRSWYEITGRSFPWRNESCTCYERIIAEILLQRTRAETVAGVFRDFVSQWSSWHSLAEATADDLVTFLMPLGLWKRRVLAIRKLSSEMARRRGRLPRKREEIERLPGVGQYIANAILLFAQNEPEPLLDVNMARVLERFFGPRKLADIRYDPYLQKLAHDVVPRKGAKEFNWAILDFASLVCRFRNPLCDTCVLRARCRYWAAMYR